MTTREAYRILGLSPDSEFEEIKKKYRKIMHRVHPDVLDPALGELPYHAHEINTAYALLKKRYGKSGKIAQTASKKRADQKHSPNVWNAPVNDYAFTDRDENLSVRWKIQPELTYLLAQQFMDATTLLASLAKEKSPASGGNRIFYIPAMLETSYPYVNLSEGEPLIPSRLKNHRLYLKKHSENELGYLSFVDDRLYYVVIPLFEQKKVQIKVKYAGNQRKLHLWVKLLDKAVSAMPESVNLQIEAVLRKYRGC